MTRWLLVLALAGLAMPAQDPPKPVFRSSSSLVTVPVSVKSSGEPVDGLTPADFVVRDNGVRQSIEALTGEAVPADVTLLVETSAAMQDYLGDMNEELRKIVAMLRPTDRFELLGVGSYVEELMPMRPVSDAREIPTLRAAGLSSINDALVAALLREPDRERPHLVIALTDTIDTMSGASMADVRRAAEHSSAIFVIAWITLSLDEPPRGMNAARPGWSTSQENVKSYIRGATQRSRREVWMPHYTPPPHRFKEAFAPLEEAADLTGGGLFVPGVFINRNASSIFSKFFANYRASYVLRYAATGVDAAGWHDIAVEIPGRRDVEIRAKRGYYVEK